MGSHKFSINLLLSFLILGLFFGIALPLAADEDKDKERELIKKASTRDETFYYIVCADDLKVVVDYSDFAINGQVLKYKGVAEQVKGLDKTYYRNVIGCSIQKYRSNMRRELMDEWGYKENPDYVAPEPAQSEPEAEPKEPEVSEEEKAAIRKNIAKSIVHLKDKIANEYMYEDEKKKVQEAIEALETKLRNTL